LIEHVQDFLRYEFLVDYDLQNHGVDDDVPAISMHSTYLENELFKPVSGHEQISFIASVFAPRILHAEFGRHIILL
jgi:hypothetical protein